jgi:predicted chitinase
MVTRAQLYKLAPGARRDIVDAIVSNWQYAVDAGLTTPKRVRPFFANICAETGGLTILEENLNYTSAARIRAVWPSRFPTLKSAAPYVGQPRKLANHVYGGRMSNKPEPSDDGWNYRGGGLLQATGLDEYTKVGYADRPDVLRRDPVAAFKSAVDLWSQQNLNRYADANQVTRIRRIINGGTNGMEEMRHYLEIAKEVWPNDADLTKVSVADQDDETATVEEVQRKLKALGYTETGKVDGKVDSYTRAAILAFRDDHGLPPGGVDDELLDAIDQAQPRQTMRAMTFMSKADVRRSVPEVMAAFYNKIVSAILAVFAFFGTLFDAISNNFSDAETKIYPLKEYFTNVPGWAWCGLIAMVSLIIYMLSHQAEASGVQAFKTGERR